VVKPTVVAVMEHVGGPFCCGFSMVVAVVDLRWKLSQLRNSLMSLNDLFFDYGCVGGCVLVLLVDIGDKILVTFVLM
jgi:hypothetical protein